MVFSSSGVSRLYDLGQPWFLCRQVGGSHDVTSHSAFSGPSTGQRALQLCMCLILRGPSEDSATSMFLSYSGGNREEKGTALCPKSCSGQVRGRDLNLGSLAPESGALTIPFTPACPSQAGIWGDAVGRSFREDLVHILSQCFTCMGNGILTHRGLELRTRDGEGLCYMFLSIWVALEAICVIRMQFIQEEIRGRSLREEWSGEVSQETDGSRYSIHL